MEKLGALRVIGVFSTIIMLIIWLAPSLVGLGSAIITGDYKGALTSTGGRVFALDNSLKEETDYLLLEDKAENYAKVFHITYALVLLFMLFFVGYYLFLAGKWLAGEQLKAAFTDVIIIVLIIAGYGLLEFIYSYAVLKVIIVPFKDGIWYFVYNLPKIVGGLF